MRQEIPTRYSSCLHSELGRFWPRRKAAPESLTASGTVGRVTKSAGRSHAEEMCVCQVGQSTQGRRLVTEGLFLATKKNSEKQMAARGRQSTLRRIMGLQDWAKLLHERERSDLPSMLDRPGPARATSLRSWRTQGRPRRGGPCRLPGAYCVMLYHPATRPRRRRFTM